MGRIIIVVTVWLVMAAMMLVIALPGYSEKFRRAETSRCSRTSSPVWTRKPRNFF